MKKYCVTVNGKRYEVEVEEVNGDFAPASSIDVPKASAPVQEVKAETAAPVKAGSGERIDSPMPGTILKVNVQEGAMVKKGDVLIILEAMKMENEIMAPRDGKIVQVAVAKGATVNTGDALVVLE